jgi:hypothetical protein
MMSLMGDGLFAVYEPEPAQCLAIEVTMDNVHQLADRFRSKMTDVNVRYDSHGATLLLHQDAEKPAGRDEIPGFNISVRTGEMLVLHRPTPSQEPLVLHPGWNTVPHPHHFETNWRKVATPESEH